MNVVTWICLKCLTKDCCTCSYSIFVQIEVSGGDRRTIALVGTCSYSFLLRSDLFIFLTRIPNLCSYDTEIRPCFFKA